MKRRVLSSGGRITRRVVRMMFLAAVVLAAVPSPSSATIVPPAGFGPDSGSKLFVNTSPGVLNFEIADVLGGGLPAVQTTFGFYFASNPNGLIPIFDPTDQGGTQAALINFAAGLVVDIDAGSVPQNSFSGTGPFGFFLQIVFAGNPPTVVRLFSDPSRNGGNDPVETFPSLTVPNQFMIGFDLPTGAGALYLDLIANVAPIPEPAMLLIFVIAVAGLGVWRPRIRAA